MRRGFTLIELTVVIALLVILAALIFPMFPSARELGRRTTCAAQMRSLGLAQQLYSADYDDQIPHWYGWDSRAHEFTFWTEFFQPYLKNQHVLNCPSGAGRTIDPGVLLAEYTLFTWGPGGDGTKENPYWRWAGPPLSLGQVVRPAETFNLMDGTTTTHSTRAFFTRHGSGMNVAFLDGHTRYLTLDQTYEVVKDHSGFYHYRYVAADKD